MHRQNQFAAVTLIIAATAGLWDLASASQEGAAAAPLSQMIVVVQTGETETDVPVASEIIAVAYANSEGWTGVEAVRMDEVQTPEGPGDPTRKDRFADFLIQGTATEGQSAAVMTPHIAIIKADQQFKGAYAGVRAHSEQGCIELKWSQTVSAVVVPPDECTTRMNS